MARIVVPYQDFSGGDWGRAQAWNAPKGTFDGLNVYVNRAGELTVRPGLRETTPNSGVVAGTVTFLAPLAGGGIVYFQGGNAFEFPPHQSGPGTTVTPSTVNNFGVTAVDYDAFAGGAAYGVTSGASIKYSFSGSTTPGTGGGVSCAVYLNRFVVAASGATLKYSDVGGEHGSTQAAGAPDFAHFTATNSLTVGDPSESIVAIRAQKTHLVVFKSATIYVITGDMPAATVRQVARTVGPFDPNGVTRSRDEMLWFVASPGMTPWRFDGTKAAQLDRYMIPSEANVGGGQVALAPLYTENNGIFILSTEGVVVGGSNNQFYGWLYYNGVWTKHTFPKPVAPYLAPSSYFGLEDPGLNPSLAPATETTLRGIREISTLTFASTDATPKFYSLSILDRPGSETRPLISGVPEFSPERAGDDSSQQVAGSVNFPEWHSQAAEEAQVRSVIVDFRSWNTGGSLTNHFDLTVNALRPWNAASPVGSQTLSWDESGSLSATGGTLKRQVFSFGDQGLGNGFQIALSNMRGISLQRVQVIVETQPLRSAA